MMNLGNPASGPMGGMVPSTFTAMPGTQHAPEKCTLFVGNLHNQVSDQILYEHF